MKQKIIREGEEEFLANEKVLKDEERETLIHRIRSSEFVAH